MVNPIYQQSATVHQLQTLFQENKLLPSIQLHNFFTKQEYKKIHQIITKTSFTHHQKPLLYSYSTAKIKQEIVPYLEEINKIVKVIIKKNYQPKTTQLLQFQHKDYTLLNDKNIEAQGYDIILDLTDNWHESFGGKLIYTNGQGESFNIPAKPNTLTIVKHTTQFQKYIEYVNHYAKKKKRFLLITNTA